MYDYKKDDGQLSEKNEIGMFAGGGNIYSDFKLHKESLPQWAVDWARNRFNMDTKSVKFYVMDEQEVGGFSAAASGNNILVTSELKNDETVIKHELTHIYQQAIGVATESNANDASLEDEAVQVSKEGEVSLAKNQTQSDRYILPREKTNVVQFSIADAIMTAIVISGMVGISLLTPLWATITVANLIVQEVKKSYKCKKTYKKLRGTVKLGLIKEVYDDFCFVSNQFDKPSGDKGLTCFERLCKFAEENPKKRSQLSMDSNKLNDLFNDKVARFFTSSHKKDWFLEYVDLLYKGFPGFDKELNEALYTEVGIPDAEAMLKEKNKEIGDATNELKMEWYIKCWDEENQKKMRSLWSLYASTGGFRTRRFEGAHDFLVSQNNEFGNEGARTLFNYTSGSYQIMMYDLSILFGKSFKEMSSTEIDEYRALCAKGLITLNPEKLSETYDALFDIRGTKDSSKRAFRYLALNTSCFTDEAKMKLFYVIRTKLSERLGITGGKKEYVYLTESLADHFEFMKDYRWETIVIYVNSVINQDEELEKCKKASDWTKEKIEKLINGTVEKVKLDNSVTLD